MPMNLFSRFAAIGLLVGHAAWPAHAEWMQQTLSLKAGWNAVFLHVQPEPSDCDSLFAGLPVESVWDFNPSTTAPQFVQDLSTLIPSSPNWLTWFPPIGPQGGISTLFALRDGRPYLIKLADTAAPLNWIVTGRPSLRPLTWHPGGVNLVGFRTGSTGPTFQTLFAGETGLINQPIYTLGTAGDWQQVASPSTVRAESGKAYWIRCSSPAQRSGTIAIEGGIGGSLTFRSGAAEQFLRIRNTSAASRNISIRLLTSAPPPVGQAPKAGAVPVDYRVTDYANTNFAWSALPTSLNFTALPAGQVWNVRLGVRLPTAPVPPGATYQSLLEVSDDAGTRWIVPVTAIPASASTAAGLAPASGQPVSIHAGLWVGDAVVNAVSQPANPGNPSLPRPSGGQFTFRLIIHVDANGIPRLLQSVYIIRKPAELAPDPANPEINIVAAPARTLVLTDDSLIPGLLGNGEIAGRRISAAAFSFKNPLTLSGAFATGNLSALITVDHNHPLNPFKHGFHPDHNNLDERFEQTLPEGKESFTFQRSIALQFSSADLQGLNPPAWGDSETGGIYHETITGVHRSAIQIAGTFRLARLTKVSALNDGQALAMASSGGH